MVRHILFDIDNTLYPASSLMDKKIADRMFGFIADFLSLPLPEAIALQRQRRKYYGTTLEWLEAEYGFVDRAYYFSVVHPPSELEELTPDPQLRSFLQSLGLPMTILTNAPMEHAERVLNFFNIADLFLNVFDITYHNGIGKPKAQCFLRTLNAVHKTVDETLFADDCLDYVQGFAALGGFAVLVDEQQRHTAISETARAAGRRIQSITSIYALPGLLHGDV